MSQKQCNDITLEESLEQLDIDLSHLKTWVNGTETQTVNLGGTSTATIRKLVSDFGEAADGQLARAEAAADRAEAAVDLTDLAGLVQNVVRSWTVPANIASGAIMDLPTGYFAGRKHMWLFYDGAFCQPYDSLGNGQYQYQEIGDISVDVLSYSVRLNFAVTAGRQFTMVVIASNAWRVSDEVQAALVATNGNVTQCQAILTQVQAEIAGIADDVSAAAQSATNAAASATAAAQSATDAAASLAEFEDLEATATTLAAGSAATASYSPTTGILTLGIPKGDQGIPGPQGDPAQMVTVDALPTTGTAGDLYLLSTDSHLYGWNISSSSWEDLGAVTVSDSVDWASVTGKPTSFTPSAHASTHGASGSDPITPESIGAVAIGEAASTATKLSTARTIYTDASVSTSATFDGTANARLGVGVQVADNGPLPTLPAVTAQPLQTWLASIRSNVKWLTSYRDNPSPVDCNAMVLPGTYNIPSGSGMINGPSYVENTSFILHTFGGVPGIQLLTARFTGLASIRGVNYSGAFSEWMPITTSQGVSVLAYARVIASTVTFDPNTIGFSSLVFSSASPGVYTLNLAERQTTRFVLATPLAPYTGTLPSSGYVSVDMLETASYPAITVRRYDNNGQYTNSDFSLLLLG